MHGQKIPPCKEMKSTSTKTTPEMIFFNRADEGNDFLHTPIGNIEGTTIFEQHKLTRDGVKIDAVNIEADAPPPAPAVVHSVPDTLMEFVPSGIKVKAMPKALAMKYI